MVKKSTAVPKEAWKIIDIDTLTEEEKKKYKQYKDGYQTLKEMRQEFEAEVSKRAPQGKRIAFGYNFGKLSIAIVDDDGSPVTAKGPVALDDIFPQPPLRKVSG
jgi:spermidine/putrescine-binding protein